MPLVAGVDIGAATAKAVILDAAGEMMSFCVVPTGHSVRQAGERVVERAVQKAGCTREEILYIVTTGYGRRAVAFSNKPVTEIICHAAGVTSEMPEARTVIDIGGQDSKVIGIDGSGNVSDFVMNDKCAAGTGRFLEVMAGVLEVPIDEIGGVSLVSKNPCKISSTCTIFAESEVIALRAAGRDREDLLCGIHSAAAHRVGILGRSVGFRAEVVFTGGVAKNEGMKKALEQEIGAEIMIPQEPQIMGALGAAIIARKEMEEGRTND